MRKTISMNILTVAVFLMLTICLFESNADEVNGVKYTVNGNSVGEKWWEKQVINTNLYDTEAEGAIIFDYNGAWAKEDVSTGGLKCTKKPGFGTFPISIQEKTPLQPLIKIKLAEDSCAIETIDGEKHVYQYKPSGNQLVIIRAICGETPSWVKLLVATGEPWAKDIVEQKKIDSWPNNNVYAVKVKKGDVLQFSSLMPSVSVWEYSEADVAKEKSAVLILHFDEGLGKIAIDSSGKNNNGTIGGGAEWCEGKFGSALKFNGKTSYVTCDKNDLSVTGKSTVSAWFKADTLKTMGLITCGIFRNRIILGAYGTGSIQGTFDVDNAYCETTVSDCYESGEWHQVATTYDGLKTKLYLDGKLIGESKENNGQLGFNGPVLIAGDSYYFEGIIDEVKIYKSALTPEEIEKDYHAVPSTLSPKECLKVLNLNANAMIISLKETLGGVDKIGDFDFTEVFSEYRKLITVTEEELAKPEISSSAYTAFNDMWKSVNSKKEKLMCDLEKVVMEKRAVLKKSISAMKTEIPGLKENGLAYRPIQTSVDMATTYENLSNLDAISSIKKFNYINDGMKCLSLASENVDKIRQNKIKDEIKGAVDKLMIAVTWDPSTSPELNTLKALQIEYIGNAMIRYSNLMATEEGTGFGPSDALIDILEKNNLKSLICFAYPVIELSRTESFRKKFENETVIGTGENYKGNVLIPAAPSDIPLGWVNEQAECLKKAIERYKDKSCILKWDLWGEASPLSDQYASSPLILSAYRKFLNEKYHEIGKLNKCWGSDYKTFEDIQAKPSDNSWGKAEWQYFSHKIMVDYLAYLTGIVKKIDMTRPISPVVCMYGMYPLNWALDTYLLSEAGGIYEGASMDLYPARRDKFPWEHLAKYLDTLRSVGNGKRVWIGELGHWINSGKPAHSNCVYPQEVREWGYTAFLHGAKFISYYTWAAGDTDAGPGSFMSSFNLMNADYTPIETAIEIGKLGCETRNYEELWSCAPERSVAIYYPRLTAYLGKGSADGEEMRGLYRIMLDLGFSMDPVDDNILKSRLSNYKILVVPPSPYVPKDVQEEIVKFVKKGGIVITSVSTAAYDENGNENPVPELTSLIKGTGKPDDYCSSQIKSVNKSGAGMVAIVDGEIGRKYRDNWEQKTGITSYQKTDYDREENKAVRKAISSFFKNGCSIQPSAVSDKEGVEVSVISNGTCKYMMIINHREQPVQSLITVVPPPSAAIPASGQSLYDIFSLKKASLSKEDKSYKLTADLDAHEVQIFRW